MSTPQRRRTPAPRQLLAAVGAAVAISWIHALCPALRTEPWSWVLLAFQVIMLVIVIAIAYLAKFVRKQRDDYWRERGKDPKHPEA